MKSDQKEDIEPAVGDRMLASPHFADPVALRRVRR